MGSTAQAQAKMRKTMPIDTDSFKELVDRVDTGFGHNDVIAELVGVLDDMIETLENHGRVYRRRRHQTAGVSGFRNVHWHAKSKRWSGRIGWTDVRGVRHRKSTGYYTRAEDASVAVEELRAKLGL